MLEGHVPGWFWTVVVVALIGMIGAFKVAQTACERRLVSNTPVVASVSVTSISGYEKLSKAFAGSSFKSASSAYSQLWAEDKSIWFLNDAVLALPGKRNKGKIARLSNAVAVGSLPCNGQPMSIYVGGSKNLPQSFLKPSDKNISYQVLDGAVMHGKIYVFALRIKDCGKHQQNELDGTDLIVITNP